MSDINTRPVIGASGAAVVLDRLQGGMRMLAASPPLSPEALAVASSPAPAPISPIVLAGFVRMAEFALIMSSGLPLYAVYLPPRTALHWRYLGATGVIAMLSIFAFQTADIYQVQAFRGYEKQYMRLASAWSLVFLIVIGASFFAKAGEHVLARLARHLLRRRADRAGRFAQDLCSSWCAQWTREGRLTRRTVIVGGGDAGAAVIEELRRQKDAGVEIIGLFDDRGEDRTGAECAGERKLGTRRRPGRVRPPHPRRSGDLLAADLGGRPHPADAEEAVGAAGRHPPRRAQQQAAIPPALLFLHRQRAGARRRPTGRSPTGTW